MPAELGGALGYNVEDMLLAVGLCLLRIHNLAGITVGGPHAQDVLVAERNDRSVNNDGLAGAFADLPHDLRRETRVLIDAHQCQGLRQLRIRQKAQVRGLRQLRRQALAQGMIEDDSPVVLVKSASTRVLVLAWPGSGDAHKPQKNQPLRPPAGHFSVRCAAKSAPSARLQRLFAASAFAAKRPVPLKGHRR